MSHFLVIAISRKEIMTNTHVLQFVFDASPSFANAPNALTCKAYCWISSTRYLLRTNHITAGKKKRLPLFPYLNTIR
jgi:hypothetical protein